MKGTIFIICLLLTACGYPKIKGYDEPEALNRHGVITASRSCINTRMKPNVIYLPQETDFGSILVPVDVYCSPYR